ncbi:MAG: hypothetical protein ACK4GJ_04400, partial [bacterium]
MSEGRKLILYPSNWLYNAGVIGFLKVLEFGGKRDTFQFKEDGSVEIAESALDTFEILYFEYVSKLYLIERFTMRELTDFIKEKLRSKNDEDMKNELKKIENKFKELENEIKKRILALKANKNWNAFMEEIENIKEDSINQLKELMIELEKMTKIEKDKEKTKKIVDNIFENFKNICDSVYNFKAQADFLGRFYF